MDFTEWMEQNQDHFTTYSPAEIADIAVAVGFDRALVTQALIHHKFGRAA